MQRTETRLISILVWALALTLFGLAQYRSTVTAGRHATAGAEAPVDAPAHGE